MKKHIKKLIVLLIVVAIIITTFCIKVNATTKGVVTEEIVNVRQTPSKEAKIVMYISVNDKVEILEKDGDWYKVKYKNKEGYAFSDFIKVDEEVKTKNEEIANTTEPQIYVEAGTSVKITPNVASINIYTASEDASINVLEQINEWSYIEINNIKGWVRTDSVKDNANIQEETKEETQETQSEEKTTINVEKSNVEPKVAYVKYDNVNLRKEPSTDAGVIEKLKLNTEVTILEEVDSVWTKVKVGNNTGYISQDLLNSEKQKEEKKKEEKNTTSRDGDSTKRENEDNKNVTTTEKKETKKEEKKTSNTSKTENKNETKKETKTSGTTNKETTKGEEIVAYAMQFLGKPYVYGGSSPKGFDCSGFTSYVYKHFGYTISRASGGQASEGTKVAKGDLEPGDLVIYKNQSLTRIGHVGLYIGNNKMIHASEPGVGVIITEIDAKSHKYPQRFVMGRRIIK